MISVVSVLLFPGCCTNRQQNTQVLQEDLLDSGIFLKTLTFVDAGDLTKARNVGSLPIFMNLGAYEFCMSRGLASFTSEEQFEWEQLARNTLDYMLKHSGEWDLRKPDVRSGIRGLRYILRTSGDLTRLQQLDDFVKDTGVSADK